MALDMKGLLQRCFSIPPGGFILSDILTQIFDPSSGHDHDGVNSAPVDLSNAVDGVTIGVNADGNLSVLSGQVTVVATAPSSSSAVGLYFCTADNKLYFNNGAAVVESAALS